MKRYITKVSGMIIFFVLFFSSLSFSDETLTITTYFPSPYGNYAELRSDRMSVGSGYRTTVIPSDSLIVQGIVGIGMASAGSYGGKQTELDVNGEIAANDIWVKDKGQWLSGVGWCKTMSYTSTSGYQECPSGTTYTWFQAIIGSSSTTVPGVFIPGAPCPFFSPGCFGVCPDVICPSSTTGGYDIPTSGRFLCCS